MISNNKYFKCTCIVMKQAMAWVATLIHLSRMNSPTLINWTRQFPLQGLMGGIYFYSNFNRISC